MKKALLPGALLVVGLVIGVFLGRQTRPEGFLSTSLVQFDTPPVHFPMSAVAVTRE